MVDSSDCFGAAHLSRHRDRDENSRRYDLYQNTFPSPPTTPFAAAAGPSGDEPQPENRRLCAPASSCASLHPQSALLRKEHLRGLRHDNRPRPSRLGLKALTLLVALPFSAASFANSPTFLSVTTSSSSTIRSMMVHSSTELRFLPPSNSRRSMAESRRPTILLNEISATPDFTTVQAVTPLTSRRLNAAFHQAARRAAAFGSTAADTSTKTFAPSRAAVAMCSFQGLAASSSPTIGNIRFQESRIRPRGRPESVAGAMKMSTMIERNERQSFAAIRHNKHDALESPNGLTVLDSGGREQEVAVTPKKGRGRPKKDHLAQNNVAVLNNTVSPSSVSPFNDDDDSDIQDLSPQLKKEHHSSRGRLTALKYDPDRYDDNDPDKRKRVVKPLPKSGRELSDNTSERGMNGNNSNEKDGLQRYYRTELLSAKEEYSLGMKVQFMMKCEDVHEGLYLHLLRLPTIAEWAFACGFKLENTNNSDGFTDVEEALIRPMTNSERFDKYDPTLFVGNGLANTNGVGRGKGGVRKRPSIELRAFYDDSVLKFPALSNETEEKGTDYSSVVDNVIQEEENVEKKLQPINRGTTQDFVRMMLTAKEAKQRMVQCNMRLVVSIAKRYKHVGVTIADLVQEGSIGLTRAVEKFEPDMGFKFSTYSSWWIQQAVFRSIACHSRTIRLPVHVHNLLNRVRRIRIQMQQEIGRHPTNEEIAAHLNMTLSKYNTMLRLTRRAISLEMPKYQNNPKDIGHESETLLGDTIDSTAVVRDDNSPEFRVNHGLFQDDLQEMLTILGEDERKVICARYGLKDGLTRTVTAVAAQLRQSKSWVRSQECRALRKLRRPWYEKRLLEHQNSLMG